MSLSSGRCIDVGAAHSAAQQSQCNLETMGQILLLNVSGQDKPGLTQSLTSILAEHNARVLDIGQGVVHETLALGLLLDVSDELPALQQSIVAKATELGVTARFTEITDHAWCEWVARSEKDRYVVTALAPVLSAANLAAVSGVIMASGLNIDAIERLSSRESLSSAAGRACVQFRVSGENANASGMRADFLALAQETGIDLAIQEEAQYGRSRRLIAFDMDSTLIQAEIIDELAKMQGVGEEVSRVTEAAMRGELDFKQSFARRLALLRGLPQSRVLELLDRVPLSDGAERLIATLKRQGYKTAILSGGFTFFGRHLQSRLGIDYLHANELEIVAGLVTGNVVPPIMDGQRKAEMLRQIADKEGITLDQTIAVGDGANDLPMLNLAGMGIAYRAKPLVRKSAQHAISTLGLDAILYLLGIRDREIQ
jgi:phosphoserine phosphatase